MSRVGKKPIQIPDKVKIKIDSGKIFVEGPKGKLDWSIPSNVEAQVSDSNVVVKRLKEDKNDLDFGGHYCLRQHIVNLHLPRLVGHLGNMLYCLG